MPALRRSYPSYPRTPFILAGHKSDLRTDTSYLDQLDTNGGRLVEHDEAQAVCDDVCAEMVVECSAKTREGLQELHDHAIRMALSSRWRHPGYYPVSRTNKMCRLCGKPSKQACECERLLLQVGDVCLAEC